MRSKQGSQPKNYNAFRESKGDFTSDPRNLRYNNITIDDWEDFIRDPASKRCLESTGDITSNPPPGFS